MAIIQAQGQGLAPIVEALLRKEQLAQEKERINLQRKDFELRAEQAEAEQQRIRDAQKGFEIAARLFTKGAGAEKLGAVPTPANVMGPALEALQQFQQTGAQTALTGAQGQIAGVEAGVAAATAPAKIEAALLEPEVLRAQLAREIAATAEIEARTRGTNLDNEYQAAANALGPEFSARLGQARALFETGSVTWGQARQPAGLPQVEGGPPDDAVFVDPSAGGAGGAEALKAKGFARQMQISNGIINSLEGSGVRLSILPSLQRQTQSATLDAAINILASPDQRRLVNAQRMFGDAYRFSLSGQQSSDREALRMLNSISSQVGDDDATRAQKSVLRETMINVTNLKAGGGITAVEAAQQGLRAARNTGDADTIELFEEILEEAIDFEGARGVANPNRPPSNAPADATSLGDSLDDERLNALLGIPNPNPIAR